MKWLAPKYLFLYTGLLLLPIACYFGFQHQFIDIQIHDTYYIVPLAFIIGASSVLYFLFALLYALFERFIAPLNRKISYLHFTFMFLFQLYFITYVGYITFLNWYYYEPSFENFATVEIFESSLLIMLVALVFLTPIVNWIYSYVKYRRSLGS